MMESSLIREHLLRRIEGLKEHVLFWPEAKPVVAEDPSPTSDVDGKASERLRGNRSLVPPPRGAGGPSFGKYLFEENARELTIDLETLLREFERLEDCRARYLESAVAIGELHETLLLSREEDRLLEIELERQANEIEYQRERRAGLEEELARIREMGAVSERRKNRAWLDPGNLLDRYSTDLEALTIGRQRVALESGLRQAALQESLANASLASLQLRGDIATKKREIAIAAAEKRLDALTEPSGALNFQSIIEGLEGRTMQLLGVCQARALALAAGAAEVFGLAVDDEALEGSGPINVDRFAVEARSLLGRLSALFQKCETAVLSLVLRPLEGGLLAAEAGAEYRGQRIRRIGFSFETPSGAAGAASATVSVHVTGADGRESGIDLSGLRAGVEASPIQFWAPPQLVGQPLEGSWRVELSGEATGIVSVSLHFECYRASRIEP